MAEINLEELVERLEKTTAEEWNFSSTEDFRTSAIQMIHHFQSGGYLHIKSELNLNKDRQAREIGYGANKIFLVGPPWKSLLNNDGHREVLFRYEYWGKKDTPTFNRYEKEIVRLYNEAMILSKERKENSIKIFETNYQEWLQEK